MSEKTNRMTKAERSDLLALIKKRERVLKTMASERSAEMMAEFEAHAASIYSFNDDAVWQAAHAEAAKAVEDARKLVEDRCRALGIPSEFAPELNLSWHGRGENAIPYRLAELRRAAKKRIEAIEAQAHTKIESMTLDAQTRLLADGLDTEAAHAFLTDAKTEMARLMPSISAVEVEKMMAPTPKRITSGYH